MGIRMSEDEAWDFLSRHTVGILTTLRAGGAPVSLPVWFAVDERTVLVSTPARSRKLARIRNDSRAAFLVETGEAWADLAAVHLSGTVHQVQDAGLHARAMSLLDGKYASLRLPAEEMPASAVRAYAERVVLQFVPRGRLLSWENARILGPRPG